MLLLGAGSTTHAAAPSLVEAYRVVAEPAGTLLVADGGRGGGRIVRIDPATGRRTLVAGSGGQVFSGAGGSARRASLGRVTDVALGPRGSIYAVASKRVVRIGRDGRLTVVARFRAALGLAVTARGVVYVTDDEGGRVLRFDPATRRTSVLATGLSQPIGIALERVGTIVVSSGHDGGRVERIDPGGRRETVVAGLALAAFVTALPDGSLLVVDHVRHDARGRVLRVAPDGRVSTLSDARILAVSSAAQARDGRIYVSAFSAPFVGRLDPETGRLVRLPTPRAS
jgi:DNA-binding beta-propeller fold protein YncE